MELLRLDCFFYFDAHLLHWIVYYFTWYIFHFCEDLKGISGRVGGGITTTLQWCMQTNILRPSVSFSINKSLTELWKFSETGSQAWKILLRMYCSLCTQSYYDRKTKISQQVSESPSMLEITQTNCLHVKNCLKTVHSVLKFPHMSDDMHPCNWPSGSLFPPFPRWPWSQLQHLGWASPKHACFQIHLLHCKPCPLPSGEWCLFLHSLSSHSPFARCCITKHQGQGRLTKGMWGVCLTVYKLGGGGGTKKKKDIVWIVWV